ncbi:MAG: fibronectin type III domain-containing protein, partial [Pelobacteraceae bacterium]
MTREWEKYMSREHTRCVQRIIIAIMFVLAFSAVGQAKGSDPVAPFPLMDTRAGLQYAKAMAVDTGGNIIVAGYTNSGADSDYMLVKFKADGSGLAWEPVYFSGTADDIATAVAIDASNNIILTGTTWNGTNNDIHTIKYNGVTGAVLWEHTYNSGGNDTATSIAIDSGGDIYVAGYAFNGTARDDFLVIKYPSAGSVPAWVELYDDAAYPNNDNRILAVAAGTNGIAVTGYSSKGGADFDILTRTYGFDKTLVREWRYASSGGGDDRGAAVKMDSAGNVIITGYATNTAGNTDIFTAKYDPASSTSMWEKIHDGRDNDEAKGVWVDNAGDVYVTGFTTTLAGNQDFFTARYGSSDGALIWNSVFDDGNGATDIPVALVVDNAADGGVFVTGYTNVAANEDYMTLKYRKDNGSLLWERSWSGSGNKNDRPVGIALEPAGAPNPRNVIVAGWSEGTTGYDFAATKYDFGALNPPTGLVATAASNTSITLTWNDNSSNEDRFYIQRKLGETGTFADITTVPATLAPDTATYIDTGLVANNYYYYRIRAYNAASGDSYYSNEARALTKVVSYDSPIWTFIHNSMDNRTDRATAITIGSDDHPIVTGFSDMTEEGVQDAHSFDYMTLKLDRADASIKWQARFDSGDGGTDQAEGVVLDNDGNALVTGTAYLFGGTDKSDDLYTIKYATATYGDPVNTPPVLWSDQYGTQSGVDQATAIEVVHDASNNSVVIGYGNGSGNTDIFIIKYAANGSRPWTPIVYDSGRNDYPTAVALDSAGDIFVTGYSYDTTPDPTGSYDWFTAKYSGTTGALIWSDTYNVSSINFGGINRDDQAFSIDVDSAGNAFVTGYATNSAGNTVFYTLKYDGRTVPAGNRRIWEKYFNYPGLNADAVALKIDPIDGALVVAGSAYISATDSDFHLIRYNSLDGAVVWERNFDKPDSYDYAYAMTLDSSGYIYLAGDSRNGVDTDSAFDNSSDILSLIYDFEGTFLGASKYNGLANKQDETTAITVNYQGEAFIAGSSTNASDNADYAVVKQKNNYILVPAPLSAAPQSDYTKIDLSWRQNTPGTSFRIERTPGPSTPLSVWELVASPASGTTTYTDSGRAAGTNYCYRIDANIGSLNSRKIEKCVSTTLAAPALSPLSVDSSTQITLNWSQVAGNTGYKIERKSGTDAWSELTTTATGTLSYVDTGLTSGTLYYYRVSTQNADGFSTPSEQSASTKSAAPVQSAPTGITSTQATLAWSNVVGETGYKIERKEGAAGTYSQIGTTGADVLTYSDSTLTSNTQYYYRVIATNASGDSEYSGEQGVLTLFTSTALSSATGSSATQIDLAWEAVSGATGYSIQTSNCNYNGNDNDVNVCNSTSYYFISAFSTYFGTWTTLANVGPGVLTYQHTPLTSGYAYVYRVVANTSGNSSAPSNVIIGWTNMTAPVLAITPASETSLTPSWSNINGASNYTLESKLGSGGTF